MTPTETLPFESGPVACSAEVPTDEAAVKGPCAVTAACLAGDSPADFPATVCSCLVRLLLKPLNRATTANASSSLQMLVLGLDAAGTVLAPASPLCSLPVMLRKQ